MPTSSLLIGVDGGASGFRAHVVEAQSAGLVCRDALQVEAQWPQVNGFQPVTLERQLEQSARLTRSTELHLEGRELEAARGEVDALLNALESLCRGSSVPMRLGLCMPGLRTRDRRGIAVRRHGPRSPSLLADLQAGCEERGLELAAVPPDLQGDGWAAALGEDVALGGQLSDVSSAYYLGAGTGLAEGLKWQGTHLDVGEFRRHLPAAWSTISPAGRSWEDEVSLGGLQQLWSRGGAGPVHLAAQAGDAQAQKILARGARALGEWLLKRLDELLLWDGRVLERVVVGQRSGQLLANDVAAPWYREPLYETLETGLRARQDTAMTIHALDAGALRKGFLCASDLRAAPALGMAACARADTAQG